MGLNSENSNLNFDLYSELFKDSLDEINKEIKENEELYDQIKQHFDKIMRSSTNGALGFIAKQTPNLITLRGNKINLLKEMNVIKKIIIDSAIKTRPKDAEDSGVDMDTLRALHDMLMHPDDSKFNLGEENLQKIETKDEELEEDIDFDEEFNKRVEELRKSKDNSDNEESSIDEEDEEIDMLEFYKQQGLFFVCDTERNLYLLNEDYDIIDEEDIVYPDWIIEFEEDEDGELKAFNQYDEEIEIVELD